MRLPKFWPLDFDPEGAIYENPTWDLPGFKRGLPAGPKAFQAKKPGKRR
jgi:hypothetical protein